MTVVDVGAGTGLMRTHLPECDYVAVEPNPSYAKELRATFAGDPRVQVIEGTAAAVADLGVTADRVLFVGLLHHLSDEAASAALADAAAILRPGGRVITLDPCIHEDQSRLAAFLVGRDRGASVRTPQAYGLLAARSFDRVFAAITDDLLPIPYSHCWMQCELPVRSAHQ
jgi:SAM-dependent methyltransferase